MTKSLTGENHRFLRFISLVVLRKSILLLACAVAASAQQRTIDNNLHAWLGYFGDHPVSERWGVHLDAQWRRHDLFANWQQYLVRPGVNFKVSDSVTLTAGYRFGESFPYGDFPSAGRAPEHRLYEQAVVRHDISERLRLSQRYRLEQRFNGSLAPDSDDVDYRYQNRFRYQLGATKPLGGTDGKWFAKFSEEVLVNFGSGAGHIFDQNRARAGLGRKTGRWGSVEAAYLHQLIQHGDGLVYESNHTLRLSWSSSAPLR